MTNGDIFKGKMIRNDKFLRGKKVTKRDILAGEMRTNADNLRL